MAYLPRNILKQSIQLTLLLSLSLPSVAEDRALIIAVGNFQNPWLKYSGNGKTYSDTYLSLPGMAEDITKMREVSRTLGYTDDQIRVLKDATADEIRESVRTWLHTSMNQGDRRLLYLSGHGSQVYNRGLDLRDLESDLMDEVFLAADVDVLGVVGERATLTGIIVDDEINQWVSQMAGLSIDLIIDTCHSGTSYRGSLEAEAPTQSQDAFAKALTDPTNAWIEKGISFRWDQPYEGLVTRLAGLLFGSDSAPIISDASYRLTYLSASRDSEKAYASPSGSVFTSALLSAVRKDSLQGYTNLNDLHEAIQRNYDAQSKKGKRSMHTVLKVSRQELANQAIPLTAGPSLLQLQKMRGLLQTRGVEKASMSEHANTGNGSVGFYLAIPEQWPTACDYGRTYRLTAGGIELLAPWSCDALFNRRLPEGRHNFYLDENPTEPALYLVVSMKRTDNWSSHVVPFFDAANGVANGNNATALHYDGVTLIDSLLKAQHETPGMAIAWATNY